MYINESSSITITNSVISQIMFYKSILQDINHLQIILFDIKLWNLSSVACRLFNIVSKLSSKEI